MTQKGFRIHKRGDFMQNYESIEEYYQQIIVECDQCGGDTLPNQLHFLNFIEDKEALVICDKCYHELLEG